MPSSFLAKSFPLHYRKVPHEWLCDDKKHAWGLGGRSRALGRYRAVVRGKWCFMTAYTLMAVLLLLCLPWVPQLGSPQCKWWVARVYIHPGPIFS